MSRSDIRTQRFLTEERHTSRSNVNWGIKVLKDPQEELAFEPASMEGQWRFLPVVWLSETQDD